MNHNFLSPIKSTQKEIEEKKGNTFINQLKNNFETVLKDGESEGKLITIVLIVLGMILVLFQAIK